MRGYNVVCLSGNIGGRLVVGKTRDNESACSFSVATDDGTRIATWVRVNAYGNIARICEKKVVKGTYVSVCGELMNREGRFGELTEVRIKEIIFFPNVMSQDRENHNDQEQSVLPESSTSEDYVSMRVQPGDAD